MKYDMTREKRVERMKLQKVLNGRVFAKDILTEHVMVALVDAVTIQEWVHLFEPLVPYLHEPEVHEFYYNMDFLDDGSIFTSAKGVEISLSEETLGIILSVPTAEICSIERCRPFTALTELASKKGEPKQAGVQKNISRENCS